MTLALVGLGIATLLELLLWLPFFWRRRQVWISLLVIILSATASRVFFLHVSVWTGLVAILTLYRIFNLLRIVQNRLQADQLFIVSRRCANWLILWQLFLLSLAGANTLLTVSAGSWWLVLAFGQLIAAATLLLTLRRQLRTTQPPILTESYADRDLPTLTVAIPARNETEELEACLKALVASSYPKLEILVLDDCSQNSRTPEIIREFAHDGVRFMAGSVPPEHWLAKNHAYAQLSKEANGEILLFCGVDARFEPDSLRVIVETMLTKKKTMLSFLPLNSAPGWSHLEDLFVQPGRYAWEMILPRRRLNRPPVLSTCWLIKRDVLHAAGGFKAVSRTIRPESFFARYALKHDDGYSFLQSSPQIGLTCQKSFIEQRLTAIRTRYPQLHRRPELIGLTSIIELTTLVLPFGMVVASIMNGSKTLGLLSALTSLILICIYAQIVALTYRQFLLRGLWLLPFAALYDIAMLNYSMWKYEFSDVLWKGRNVCIPVMRVIPHLPNISE